MRKVVGGVSRASEIAEDLDDLTSVGVFAEWHHANGRYVIDGVPFTSPQVSALFWAYDKFTDWVQAIADEVHGRAEAS